jgi:hypothetical protein
VFFCPLLIALTLILNLSYIKKIIITVELWFGSPCFPMMLAVREKELVYSISIFISGEIKTLQYEYLKQRRPKIDRELNRV